MERTIKLVGSLALAVGLLTACENEQYVGDDIFAMKKTASNSTEEEIAETNNIVEYLPIVSLSERTGIKRNDQRAIAGALVVRDKKVVTYGIEGIPSIEFNWRELEEGKICLGVRGNDEATEIVYCSEKEK